MAKKSVLSVSVHVGETLDENMCVMLIYWDLQKKELVKPRKY